MRFVFARADFSQELNYNEFRMFTLACIDKKKELEARTKAPTSKICSIM